MRLLLPLIALAVLLFASPVWSEEDPSYEAERAQLAAQGQELIKQGTVDYERLQQALAEIETQKAELAAAGGSLGAMDQLAKRAEMLRADLTELKKARSRLEDAKGRLVTGRFEAAKQIFNEAVSRWAKVHKSVVAHLGEAPSAVRVVPPTGGGEVAALRKEVQALRAEVQALRTEVNQLKALLQRDAR